MFGCYYKNELENNMPNMTLENIAKACDGTYVGEAADLEKVITGAVTDSRQIEKGYLFIPIKGERVDGQCLKKAHLPYSRKSHWIIRQVRISLWIPLQRR